MLVTNIIIIVLLVLILLAQILTFAAIWLVGRVFTRKVHESEGTYNGY